VLIKNSKNIEKGVKVTLKKYIDKKDVTPFGAFGQGEKIVFEAFVPRLLGVSGVVLRMERDGSETSDFPFLFCDSSLSLDLYTLTLDTRENEVGLYFYELIFLRGRDTLFSSTCNNLDFTLERKSDKKFHLLLHDPDLKTPHWFKGGVIYHVFLDRFFRGEGKAELHVGSINEDWERGIPQFAKKVGDPLKNDVFFGGNLWGVIEKLDYLKSLGVTVLYLSPIFEAKTNHRYDTSDYEKIDSLLGGEKAFVTLIKKAHEKDIKIILDGVFNHTGDNSRYFNKWGSYGDEGAYLKKESRYYDWYNFYSYPESYESWWGIDILPRLNHENEDCRKYFTGESGIGRRWIEKGADGWRLDVADELTDTFLCEFYKSVKDVKDAVIIGEVWENAVTKKSYSERRRYFWGGRLDSVMNYPLRDGIIALLKYGDTKFFYNKVTELYSSYPKEVLHSLMNVISTHDTVRVTTVFGDENEGKGEDNDTLSKKRLTKEERIKAIKKLKMASLIQFTLFGVPSLYYGDEIGIEGYHDPFCRMPFDWKNDESDLLEHFRYLGKLRKEHPALKEGDFKFLYVDSDCVVYERSFKIDKVTVGINLSKKRKKVLNLIIEKENFVIV